MSNSTLVNYTKISPNSTNPRNKPISKITIHHAAGNASVELLGDIFAKTSRQASSNYGIGSDGRVGLYVDEHNRAWTSGNADNDNQAINIEVANDGGSPDWHVSDKALAKLIELCVDICKRNGIDKLNFTGDKNGNLTMHKWYQATACPGPYLESKFKYIADEVNKKLVVDVNNKVLVTEAQHTLTATITVNESKTKAIIDSLKKQGFSVTDKVTKQAVYKDNPTKTNYKNYTVKNGDSFWSIAQSQLKNGTRYKDLASFNNLDVNSVIHSGQILKIPTTN